MSFKISQLRTLSAGALGAVGLSLAATLLGPAVASAAPAQPEAPPTHPVTSPMHPVPPPTHPIYHYTDDVTPPGLVGDAPLLGAHAVTGPAFSPRTATAS